MRASILQLVALLTFSVPIAGVATVSAQDDPPDDEVVLDDPPTTSTGPSISPHPAGEDLTGGSDP